MTYEQLILEGRKLQRPCVFLRPAGPGPVAAVWYDRDEAEIESSGYRRWLAVDGGRIKVTSHWPMRKGTRLFAHPASVLPPIDAVFALGSEAIGEWLASHGWERGERYNDSFKDRALVEQYEDIWTREFPIYFNSDIYAVLGGWHFPCADDDWHDLLDDQLMVFTIRDSEPWVEAWRTKTGQFKVIQRIT